MKDNSFNINNLDLVVDGYFCRDCCSPFSIVHLTAISVPNILQNIKSNRINEAKILMDSTLQNVSKNLG